MFEKYLKLMKTICVTFQLYKNVTRKVIIFKENRFGMR